MEFEPSVGQVYALEAQGLGRVKIGCVFSPTHLALTRRASGIQADSPVPLRLRALLYTADDPRHCERELHARFDALRLHNEWFTIDGDLETWLDEQTDALDDYIDARRASLREALGEDAFERFASAVGVMRVQLGRSVIWPVEGIV
jgi:hypothetical protein